MPGTVEFDEVRHSLKNQTPPLSCDLIFPDKKNCHVSERTPTSDLRHKTRMGTCLDFSYSTRDSGGKFIRNFPLFEFFSLFPVFFCVRKYRGPSKSSVKRQNPLKKKLSKSKRSCVSNRMIRCEKAVSNQKQGMWITRLVRTCRGFFYDKTGSSTCT